MTSSLGAPAAATPQTILDSAQRIIQTVGYNGLSFRDVATEVGIKSASVHYHFPTKGRLAAAVMRRYTDALAVAATEIDQRCADAGEALAAYVGIFRQTVEQTGRICLGGMLAAEADALPNEVQVEVRRFIDINVDWLSAVLERVPDDGSSRQDRRHRAVALFAALEGAMLVARGSGDFSRFDAIARQFRRVGLLPD